MSNVCLEHTRQDPAPPQAIDNHQGSTFKILANTEPAALNTPSKLKTAISPLQDDLSLIKG